MSDSGRTRSPYVDQTGLELTELCLSLPSAGNKGVHHKVQGDSQFLLLSHLIRTSRSLPSTNTPTVTTLSPSGTEATLSSYHSTFILAQWLVLLSILIGLDTARETSLKGSFTLLLWGDLLLLGQVMDGWDELPGWDGPRLVPGR